MTKCKNISVSEMQALQNESPIRIIDIRTADEFAREAIKGAENIPADQLHEAVFQPHEYVVFHCQAGNRTRQCASLLEKINAAGIYILEGGLNAWKQAGQPLAVNNKAPLPLMRQVQIIVGTMVLLGVISGWLVSPWFTLISAFFGAGLLFAGISGYCGMARLLMLLPYNRQS